MKAIFQKLLFVTLCTVQALSNPDPERVFTVDHEGFNLTKHNTEGQQEEGMKGNLGFVKELRKIEENHGEVLASMKGQKGTGAYGGANIVHNPHSNIAATLSRRHSLFVSAILSLVNFAFVLVSLF